MMWVMAKDLMSMRLIYRQAKVNDQVYKLTVSLCYRPQLPASILLHLHFPALLERILLSQNFTDDLYQTCLANLANLANLELAPPLLSPSL